MLEFPARDGFAVNAIRADYDTGDTFYEPPGAVHSVSRNAGEVLPASLIACFALRGHEIATVYDGEA